MLRCRFLQEMGEHGDNMSVLRRLRMIYYEYMYAAIFGQNHQHSCINGLRGPTQVRMYSYSWVQIPPNATLWHSSCLHPHQMFIFLSLLLAHQVYCTTLLRNMPLYRFTNFHLKSMYSTHK